MIGGEGPESASWLDPSRNLEWTRMARQQGAMMFILEHRYYGASQPFRDLSTPNLRFLSSVQMLEDVGTFIPAMITQFNLQGAKWIAFGGSYSGSLAAWMRQRHPELIIGAVGSSGPVQAKVDFFEYLEVVQDSLTSNSAQCAQSLSDGLQQIAQLITTGAGRTSLRDYFDLCFTIDPNNANDISYFYEGVIGAYMGVVQYSYDNVGVYRSQLTIKKICEFMEDTSNAVMRRMQLVNRYVMSFYGESCTYNSYAGWIEFAQQTGINADSASDRAWLWQTCTEFGYYQSTDTPRNFYGQVIGIDYIVKQCAEIYGSQLTNASVYAAVDSINMLYGGRDNFRGTNVMLPNGNLDPWHALGILTSAQPTVTAVVITGTAHVADMYPPAADDVPGLTAARETIESQVNIFLS